MPRIKPSKKSNPTITGQQNQAKQIQNGILESAEVVDIILDPSHPAFNPSQYRVIGSIQARAFPREFGISGDSCSWYNPLFPNLRQYPLLGEIVVLLAAAGRAAQLRTTATEKYYISMPVGVWQGVNQNGLPAASYNINKAGGDDKNYRSFTGNPKGDVNDIPFGNTFADKVVARIFPFEGDTILEGRFGQSLRFGSTVTEPETPNDWSKDGIDGDPITIISNGHSTTDGGYHQESINEDASGIWLLSGQSVPIDVSSKLADSYGQAYESAKEAEREAVAGPAAAELPTGGGASSGGSAESQQASSPGSENQQPGDSGETAATEVEADADIAEAVEELEEVGELDAYSRGRFTEKITVVVIDGKPVNKAFADKILTVKQAASKDGVTVKLNSGFRPMEAQSGAGWSTSGQRTLRRQNADKSVGGTKTVLNTPAGTYEDGFAAQQRQTSYFKPLTAGQGYYNHQNGKAFDIQTGMGRSLEPYDKTTKTYRWLVANMHKYGFIRTVAKERWHWEYHPGAGMFSRVPRNHGTWDNLV